MGVVKSGIVRDCVLGNGSVRDFKGHGVKNVGKWSGSFIEQVS